VLSFRGVPRLARVMGGTTILGSNEQRSGPCAMTLEGSTRRPQIWGTSPRLSESLVGWESPDLHNISGCGDLRVHVQKHPLTIPPIEASLDENNLAFGGSGAEDTALETRSSSPSVAVGPPEDATAGSPPIQAARRGRQTTD
jgi:hypothetical protein